MNDIPDFLRDRIIDSGKSSGFQWIVAHNNMGFRCGYVRVEATHTWYKKHYNDIEADVHGGLTYSGTSDFGWWVGFDCAHSGDGQDLSLPCELMPGWGGGVVRDTDYVRKECTRLCEQARQAVERID